MPERSELQRVALRGPWPARSVAGFFLLAAANACSSQTAPAAGVQAPTGTVGKKPVPAAPAGPSALPVLTPTGAVSARPTDAPSDSASSPLPPPAPSASAEPAAPRQRAPEGKLCGGFAGIRCADKLYCSFSLSARCGAGDMAGTCKRIPDLCTMVFAPVCGCDGKTYASVCVAGRSGVSVAKNGACPPDDGARITEGKTCGTRGVVGECAHGLYCAFHSQCGATDAGGSCQKKPELCPHLVQPVCGCDSRGYNNACEAARAGVSVASSGRCQAN